MSTISQGSDNQLAAPNDSNGVVESGFTYKGDTLVSATINGKEVNQYIFDNFNAFDKDGNGALTQTEINQQLDALGIKNTIETISNNHYEQIYKKYMAPADLDKNGEVTAQELQNKYRFDGQPITDANTDLSSEQQYALGLKDPNKPIDWPRELDEQMEQRLKDLHKKANQELVDGTIKMFDNKQINTNGDGFIDQQEALAAGSTQEEWNNALKQADLDGNNKLSVGEWLIAANNGQDIDLKEFAKNYGESAANKLTKYDLNNDGKVTQDEIKSYDKQLDKSNDNIIDKFNNLSTEAKVGIIITGVIVIAAIVALIVALATKKDKKKEESTQVNVQQQKSTSQRGMMPQAYAPQIYYMPQPYMMPQANYGYGYQNIGYNVSNSLNSVNRSQGTQI